MEVHPPGLELVPIDFPVPCVDVPLAVVAVVRNLSRFQLAEFSETFGHEVPEGVATVHRTADEVAFVQTSLYVGVNVSLHGQTRMAFALCFPDPS